MYLCILLYMYVNIKTNTKVTPHKYMYKVSPKATDQMKKIPKDNGGSDKELAIAANNDFY